MNEKQIMKTFQKFWFSEKQPVNIFAALTVLGLILSLAGCEKAPVEEMAAATEALIRAENDPDAVSFGETSLNRARDSAFRMRMSANSKRYEDAIALAAETISAAEKAISDGRAAAQRARDEAAGLIASVKESFTEINGLISSAGQRGLKLDYLALDKDMEDVRSAIEQAEADAVSRPKEAIDKAQSARAALSDIRSRISQGAREVSSKK
ncbi:MAG: hypothetical protein LBU18_02675 [Treponema sp.]|jgi:hypothetical protein|nr:hypothetical protein [Treponema sp.]